MSFYSAHEPRTVSGKQKAYWHAHRSVTHLRRHGRRPRPLMAMRGRESFAAIARRPLELRRRRAGATAFRPRSAVRVEPAEQNLFSFLKLLGGKAFKFPEYSVRRSACSGNLGSVAPCCGTAQIQLHFRVHPRYATTRRARLLQETAIPLHGGRRSFEKGSDIPAAASRGGVLGLLGGAPG